MTPRRSASSCPDQPRRVCSSDSRVRMREDVAEVMRSVSLK
ncbi:hypothetical protein ACFPRL_18520 [Pseudoclavibacter helvolus]